MTRGLRLGVELQIPALLAPVPDNLRSPHRGPDLGEPRRIPRNPEPPELACPSLLHVAIAFRAPCRLVDHGRALLLNDRAMPLETFCPQSRHLTPGVVHRPGRGDSIQPMAHDRVAPGT